MKFAGIGVHLRLEDVVAPAQAFSIGPLFVSGLEIADDQALSDRDLLLRIASARASLVDRETFIAIRYGFTFRNATEAESKCAGRLDVWKRLLEEHRGRVEFTLKVAAPGSPRPDRRDFRSGADYLRALHDAREAASVPAEFREAVEKLIVPLAIKHQWIKRDASSVELAGLIDRSSLDHLASAGAELKQQASSVPFLLSAPWPLEVFADVDHQ